MPNPRPRIEPAVKPMQFGLSRIQAGKAQSGTEQAGTSRAQFHRASNAMSIAASLGKHPSLEHDPAGTRYFQSIAVRSRRTCRRLQFTVWPVKLDEFLHISEQ